MITIDHKEITITKRIPRIVRLRAEYYEYVEDPDLFLRQLNEAKVSADIVSFLQRPGNTTPKYPYPMEYDEIALLRIETYDKWWKQTINDKTRNMVRKAGKKGVTIRAAEFNKEFVEGIKAIYDESPIRQGRKFKHYGKDLETLWREHVTFQDRSDFIGAYLENQLIGFIKLVHQGEYSNLMQIISLMSHRDKASSNALIAKAVEICAERKCSGLQYGSWSRRSIGEFKIHHGFECVQVPRYYIPLTVAGRCALRLKLHRNLVSFIPGTWQDVLAGYRAKWYARTAQ